VKKSPQKKELPLRKKKAANASRKRGGQTPEDGIRIAFFTGIFIFTSILVVLILFILCSPQPMPEAALVPKTAPVAPVEQPPLPAAPPSVHLTPAAPVEQPPLPAAPPSVHLTPAAPVEQPPLPAPEHRGTLVFVIDDAGNNLRELEPFLNFPGPLTIAVLPGLPHSAETARQVRAAGKEVFLHQPMEALGGQDPGPNAVYIGMSREEVRAVIERNLDEIWPAVGMNNHQGSRITMDEGIMETVLSLCRERKIVFLDSRTTADTTASLVAQRLGMTIGERDVFLDNEQEREAMLRSVSQGLAKANSTGFAVMIGHTWSPELAALLMELYSDLTGQGYSLTTVSRYIKNEDKQ
jgi:polysaccharide deacetylase 2 family uncharacterized protein YibQ